MSMPPDAIGGTMTITEWERRAVVSSQLRIDQSAGSYRPIIRGYAIVFKSLSENLGGFRERIMPQAMDRTLSDKTDLRALVDHDTSKVLGRISAGTLSVRADEHGLAMQIDPPNTSFARDLVESIRRGDVSGCSFGFRVVTDDWHLEDGVPIREILDMSVREVSVVTFPAYPETDVSMAQRALAAFQARQKPPVTVETLRQEMEAKRARWARPR